ncbi:MAG TPA: hypothetical protein VGL39_14175 [Jatrophihabitantaceae bacterium]|jgi:hypothetical protein
MTTSRFERLLPLAGALGGLVATTAMILTINEPSITDGEQKYVRWYSDHQAVETIAGFAAIYFCVLMLFFATAVRRALRSGERGSSAHANAAFAGGIVFGIGITLMAMVSFANVEAADKHNVQAVISLGYLSDSTWLLFIAGLAAFYLATGLGSLRTGALPKWLAIVTIVLGVLSLTGPTGIAVFFATPVWLIVTSILLYRRQEAPATPAVVPAPQSELSEVRAH